ncbi:hypothetical protein RAG37_11500 [Klebsiella pneumoniae]
MPLSGRSPKPFDTHEAGGIYRHERASDKTQRVHEHYGEALAVDGTAALSRYEAGIWKVIPAVNFENTDVATNQRLRAPFSSGRIASSGGDAEADYSSAGRTGTPSD